MKIQASGLAPLARLSVAAIVAAFTLVAAAAGAGHADERADDHAISAAGTPVQTTPVVVTDAPSGERTPVPLRVRGTSAADGLVIRIDYYHPLPYHENYSNCVEPDNEPGYIFCAWPNMTVAAGQIYQINPGTPLGFDVLDDAPGPLNICRHTYRCGYRAEAVGAAAAAELLARDGGGMTGPTLNLVAADGQPSDAWGDYSEIELITAADSVDLEALGADMSGHVNQQVSVEVGVTNADSAFWTSPAKGGGTHFIVTLPTGLDVIQKPELCDSDDGRVFRCFAWDIYPHTSVLWTFTAKITKPGSHLDGVVFFDTEPDETSWYDTNLDPHQSNNTARLALNPNAPHVPTRGAGS